MQYVEDAAYVAALLDGQQQIVLLGHRKEDGRFSHLGGGLSVSESDLRRTIRTKVAERCALRHFTSTYCMIGE